MDFSHFRLRKEHSKNVISNRKASTIQGEAVLYDNVFSSIPSLPSTCYVCSILKKVFEILSWRLSAISRVSFIPLSEMSIKLSY